MHAKFNDSSFSRTRDITGGSKFKVDRLTLTTPILSVICQPYAGTMGKSIRIDHLYDRIDSHR